MHRGKAISNLGFVASGKRAIGSGAQYDKYFDLRGLEGSDPIISSEGTNHDTLRAMETIARRKKGQTKALSAKLKASDLNQTLSNIWSFLYGNIQYKKDAPDTEQLRTPLRSWKDRKSGVDCDCFSIFVSSILHNLGISHAFRMAAYKGDYQHVYVVVPKDGNKKSLETKGQYYTVDAVVDQYNYEVPFSKKFDRFMALQMLNGLGDAPTCSNVKPTKNVSYQDLLRVTYIEENGLIVTEKFLTNNLVPFDKSSLPNGAVRYHVGKMTVGPVITKQEASALISPANTAPQTTPAPTTPGQPTNPGTPSTTQKEDASTWKWILGGSALLIVASQGPKVINGLAGLVGLRKKKTKKKNLK